VLEFRCKRQLATRGSGRSVATCRCLFFAFNLNWHIPKHPMRTDSTLARGKELNLVSLTAIVAINGWLDRVVPLSEISVSHPAGLISPRGGQSVR